MHPLDRMVRLAIPLGAVAILATIIAVGVITEPDRFVMGYSPEQPIPFSHKLHAGKNHIPCQYCHTNASRSRHATVPAVGTCMNCHLVTKTDSPAIKKLTAIWKSGEPLEWRRVYELPDHVYFDHRPHVNAGIACQSCHGEVQTMDRISRELNMRMGNCLRCHRDPHVALPASSTIKQAPTNCYTCHR
jgi:hypothetical protein